jgi:hypothetical protein
LFDSNRKKKPPRQQEVGGRRREMPLDHVKIVMHDGQRLVVSCEINFEDGGRRQRAAAITRGRRVRRGKRMQFLLATAPFQPLNQVM